MSDHTPTLGELLSIPGPRQQGKDGDAKAGKRFEEFTKRVDKELKEIRWPTSAPKLVDKLADLLNIPLPKVMIAAWEKVAEIRAALDESLKSPEEVQSLALTEHTLTTDFKPQIEMRIGEAFKKTIEFVVELTLTLNEFELEICAGHIRKIKTGTCVAAGAVKYDDLVIAKREFLPLDLPGEIPLGSVGA